MKKDEQMFVPIDERLFLPADKRIHEMMTISLDPDIAVMEKEEFVQLQGQVLLQGKYKKVPDNHVTVVTIEDKPYMKDIQELHDDEVIFAHPFPVEITIAAYRIEKISDITVKVAHFDYEVVEPEKMHVKARLEIAGLQPIPQTSMEETNKIEAKEVEAIAAQSVEKAASEQEVDEVIQEEVEMVDLSSKEKEEVVEPIVIKQVKEKEELVAIEDTEEAAQDEVSETVEAQAVHIGHTEDEDASEHTMFLRQLFVDEEGKNKRVTLYITQSQDTIETVANRYEISTYQLMKDNDLTEDLLEAGQILIIR